MALDKVLKVYDDNGNEIDYDILAKDVKILPDGKDLPTKLAELEDEIGQGGYAPPQGGIPKTDLAQSVQDSLDKADSALQDEDVAEVAKTGDYNDLQNKPAIPDTSGLATKTELNAKQDKIQAGNGIVIGNDGKTVSVDAKVVQPVNADGTFTIRIGNDTYTINLNHTHENMAKLEKHTPATMPDAEDMEDDTIYAEIEDGEVNVLYIGGIPFYGGGGAVSGPVLRRPADGSTINMGETENGSANKAIKVKGKNLTQALTIELDGTGYTFGNTQPSGVSFVNNTELTVTAAAANALNGVDIVVVYTGSDTDENASGTLGITSGTPDNVSVEATLVANRVVVEDLTGVKLTGSQWLQTDYYPNPNTEFELSCKFIENSISTNTSSPYNQYFIDCVQTDAERFSVYNGNHDASNPYGSFVVVINNDTNRFNNDPQLLVFDASEEAKAAFLTDMLIKYQKGVNRMDESADTATFSAEPKHLPLKGTTMSNALMIGRSRVGDIYNCFDLVIYELKIKENGSIVHDWVPKLKNGSTPGLYDTVTDTFISSETSTELVAVPLT